MMYLLVVHMFLVYEPVFRYADIPGFKVFDEALRRSDQTAKSYLVVHEDSHPEFLDRLYGVARAVLPETTPKEAAGAEDQFVSSVLKQIWGVEYLHLDLQATDSLFYGSLQTTAQKPVILFTNTERVAKNMDQVPMSASQLWEGLMVVVRIKNRDLVVVGARR